MNNESAMPSISQVDNSNKEIIKLLSEDFYKARKLAEETVKQARKIKYDEGLCLSLAHLGWFYLQMSDIEEGIQYLKESYKLATEVHHQEALWRCCYSFGKAYSNLGFSEMALSYAIRGIAILNPIEQQKEEALFLFLKAEILLDLGRADAALPIFTQTYHYWLNGTVIHNPVAALYKIIEANITLGELEAAQKNLKEAEKYNKIHNLDYSIPELYYLRGLLYIKLKKIPKAISYFQKSISISNESGYEFLKFKVNNKLAELLAESKPAKAVEHLNTAIIAGDRLIPSTRMFSVFKQVVTICRERGLEDLISKTFDLFNHAAEKRDKLIETLNFKQSLSLIQEMEEFLVEKEALLYQKKELAFKNDELQRRERQFTELLTLNLELNKIDQFQDFYHLLEQFLPQVVDITAFGFAQYLEENNHIQYLHFCNFRDITKALQYHAHTSQPGIDVVATAIANGKRLTIGSLKQEGMSIYGLGEHGSAVCLPFYVRETRQNYCVLLYHQNVGTFTVSPFSGYHHLEQIITSHYIRVIREKRSGDEYKNLLDRLSGMEKELKQERKVAHSKDIFLSRMATSLRLPIGGILGMSSNLLSSELNVPREEQLDSIQGMAKNLLDNMNNILEYYRIKDRQLFLEKGYFELHDFCESLISSFNQRFPFLSDNLILEEGDSLPIKVYGDHRKIHRILSNLIENSIVYGSYPITVKVVLQPLFLSFYICDRGTPIEHDIRDKIYDPFFSTSIDTAKDSSRSGLGLTIAKELAEMMDSKLVLEDSASGENIFSLSIPIEQLAIKKSSSQGPVHDHLPKILLAEDNPLNQKFLLHILQKKGFKVLLAEDGFEVLELLKDSQPDIILMDIQMPGKDGLTVIRELRSSGLTLPIIAMTAYFMDDDKEKIMASGADQFMTKPVNVNRLIESIEALTGGQRSE